jgi:hypothetical protein
MLRNVDVTQRNTSIYTSVSRTCGKHVLSAFSPVEFILEKISKSINDH